MSASLCFPCIISISRLCSLSHKGGDRIRGEATSPDTAMLPILKPRKGTRPLQGPAPDPAPRRALPLTKSPTRLRALPRHPGASSQRRRQRGTHCAIVRLRLRSVNWPIQARPAYIDVTGLGEGFQQLQQRPRVQIVVVIHMAEPSVGMEWGTLNSERVPKSFLSARLPLHPHSQSTNR